MTIPIPWNTGAVYINPQDGNSSFEMNGVTSEIIKHIQVQFL